MIEAGIMKTSRINSIIPTAFQLSLENRSLRLLANFDPFDGNEKLEECVEKWPPPLAVKTLESGLGIEKDEDEKSQIDLFSSIRTQFFE